MLHSFSISKQRPNILLKLEFDCQKTVADEHFFFCYVTVSLVFRKKKGKNTKKMVYVMATIPSSITPDKHNRQKTVVAANHLLL